MPLWEAADLTATSCCLLRRQGYNRYEGHQTDKGGSSGGAGDSVKVSSAHVFDEEYKRLRAMRSRERPLHAIATAFQKGWS